MAAMVLCIFGAIFCATARAQDDAENWFRQLHAEANAELSFEDTELRWRVDWPSRQSGTGGGRDLLLPQYQLWFESADQWRLSRGSSDGTDYVDVARNGSTVWVMTPQQLTVISTSNPKPGLESLAEAGPDGFRHVREHMFAGLGMGESIERFESAQNGRWSARVVAVTGCIFEYTGTWISGLGTIEGSRLIECSGFEHQIGSSKRFSEWEIEHTLGGRRVSRRVVVLRPDGTVERENDWLGAIKPSGLDVPAAIAVPEPDAVDPVRGAVTFTAIRDQRGDLSEFIVDDERNAILARRVEPDPRQRIRTIGWVLLGTLVVVAVVLRAKRG